MEKAYDTTWKRGRLPLFISDFLKNRKFSVQIGATLSELYDQEEGVPQGSILSVTLFSLIINDIVKVLTNGINCFIVCG